MPDREEKAEQLRKELLDEDNYYDMCRVRRHHGL